MREWDFARICSLGKAMDLLDVGTGKGGLGISSAFVRRSVSDENAIIVRKKIIMEMPVIKVSRPPRNGGFSATRRGS